MTPKEAKEQIRNEARKYVEEIQERIEEEQEEYNEDIQTEQNHFVLQET